MNDRFEDFLWAVGATLLVLGIMTAHYFLREQYYQAAYEPLAKRTMTDLLIHEAFK